MCCVVACIGDVSDAVPLMGECTAAQKKISDLIASIEYRVDRDATKVAGETCTRNVELTRNNTHLERQVAALNKEISALSTKLNDLEKTHKVTEEELTKTKRLNRSAARLRDHPEHGGVHPLPGPPQGPCRRWC